ncbi:unnamed protein product [Prunus armeniaca]|uniref:Uncharacterized protein n=1 Tax=Prunus armeniaca TaxID=36596 RepID=A0A6J5WFZ4_PRUAR|nr:unnamed protein product [Prunus armeniaca]CAB4299259.1 unnamed protein product [Prunus armeniaca]
MGYPTKIPPILITNLAKNAEPLSQRNNKAADVADGAAKSINFSCKDHDDVAWIGKMRYDALIMEIKRLKIPLRWYEETLGKEKKKAKFHLRSVQRMKVRVWLAKGKGVRRFSTSNESVQMREAEARKGFDLFHEFARCVVPSYNWDEIAME